MRRIGSWAVAVVGVVLLLTLPGWMPAYYLTLTNRILFYSLLAVSFSFLAGRAGMTSLGQVAFFGFAAYAAGIMTARYSIPFPWPVVVGVGGAALLAAAAGLIVIRTTGIYFLMITLALGQVMWGVANRWVSLTHAYDGIPGVVPPVVMGVALKNPSNFYFALLATSLACFAVMLAIARSHFGLALRGIAASPTRMAALGYPVSLLRYLAFVLAGTLAGISGIFYVYHTGFVHTSVFDLQRSVWILLVSTLGGVGTFAGPIVGVAIVVLLESFIGQLTHRHATVIGTLFMLTIILAPQGVTGHLGSIADYVARRRGARPAAPGSLS